MTIFKQITAQINKNFINCLSKKDVSLILATLEDRLDLISQHDNDQCIISGATTSIVKAECVLYSLNQFIENENPDININIDSSERKNIINQKFMSKLYSFIAKSLAIPFDFNINLDEYDLTEEYQSEMVDGPNRLSIKTENEEILRSEGSGKPSESLTNTNNFNNNLTQNVNDLTVDANGDNLELDVETGLFTPIDRNVVSASLESKEKSVNSNKDNYIKVKSSTQSKRGRKRKSTSVFSKSPKKQKPPQECPICQKMLNNSASLEKHMRAIHEITREHITCHLCRFVVSSQEELSNHKVGHEPGHYLCCRCVFLDLDSILRHREEAHGEKLNKVALDFQLCPNCNLVLSNPASLKLHIERIHNTTLFNCPNPICPKSFKTREVLDAHLARSHAPVADGFFQCSACLKCFGSHYLTMKHQLSEHKEFLYVDGDENASIDQRQMNLAKLSESQLSSVRKKRGLKIINLEARKTSGAMCKLCSKSFHTGCYLKKHLSQMHGIKSSVASQFTEKLFLCAYCKNSYIKIEELQSHFEKVHGMPLGDDPTRCASCHRMYPKDSHEIIAQEPLASSDSEQPVIYYKCDKCLLSDLIDRSVVTPAVYPADFDKDLRVCASCEFCGEVFNSTFVLNTHSAREHNKPAIGQPVAEKYSCVTCEGVKFNTKELFLKHAKEAHEGKEEYEIVYLPHKYRCPDCKKIFRKDSGRRHHWHIKHGGQRYSCPDCGKVFTLKDTVIKHYQVHHQDQRFQCTQCQRQYKVKRALLEHIREEHDMVRDYICQYCGAEFARRTTYALHVRRHERPESIKKYKYKRTPFKQKHHPGTCKICGRHFTEIGSVRRHMRRAHPESVLLCPVCQRQFLEIADLRHHIRKEHRTQQKLLLASLPEQEQTAQNYHLSQQPITAVELDTDQLSQLKEEVVIHYLDSDGNLKRETDLLGLDSNIDSTNKSVTTLPITETVEESVTVDQNFIVVNAAQESSCDTLQTQQNSAAPESEVIAEHLPNGQEGNDGIVYVIQP